MQIQQNKIRQFNTKQISFSGQKLLKLNLKGFNEYNIPAFFSRLKKDDITPNFIQSNEFEFSEFGHLIVDTFIKSINRKKSNEDYFTIKTLKEKQIKGIAKIFKKGNKIKIKYLQELSKRWEELNGIGSGLIYGICKFAKEEKFSHIQLYAAHRGLLDFYKKLGFTQSPKNPFVFFIPEKNFNSFLENIEKKYKI